jgi:hypothetical protein
MKRLALIILALIILAIVGAVAAQVAVDCVNALGLFYRCNDVFVMVVFGG